MTYRNLFAARAPVAQRTPKTRRPRRATLRAALREADKAGRPVVAAALYPDHIELTFGQPRAPMPAFPDSANPWDSIYETEQKRPS
jgi:hypothetical protein